MSRQDNNEYTIKEIINRIEGKQEKYHDEYITKMDAVITQVTKTNGRVNKAECDILEIKDQSKDMVKSNLEMWIKISGLAAAVALIITIIMTKII